MDRFIETPPTASLVDCSTLKSNMDRFIDKALQE